MTPQGDWDKLRRLPYLYASGVLTSAAVLSTVQAPLSLFALELGLSDGQIGILGGIVPFFQVIGIAALPLITRWGARRIAAIGMALRYLFLLTFLVVPVFAGDPGTIFVILLATMIGFSLLRSLSEAAYVPWSQEFLPRAVRGRVGGVMALVVVPVALVLSWGIGTWLDASDGIGRFYPVFLGGIVAGIAGAAALFGLRGGAPGAGAGRGLRNLGVAIADRNFVLFLFASSTQYLVFVAINLFLVLFFRDRLGMSAGDLVLWAAFIPVGGAMGSLVAGWFVDRYGTHAIRLSLGAGQVVLLCLLPLVPAETAWAGPLVAAIFLVFGLLFQSGLGVDNVYMLNAVPPAAKESYMALRYSVDGIVGGGATFAAGGLLLWLDQVQPAIGSFGVLFLLAAGVAVASGLAFSRLREEGAISVRDFIAHVSTGSVMRALWGIHRYGRSTSEERRLDLAHGFGTTGSLLAKEELIEALHDPSFDVRHEAIRALGRMGPNRAVVRALEGVLAYDGLVELQYAALGALGRARAVDSAGRIGAFLDDPNPLLRARAARTLGDLRAARMLPRIREMLVADAETDCRLAAASALGKLGDRDSVAALVALYVNQSDPAAGPMAEPRSKVVLLALAKITACEESFAWFWRREERSPGLALPGLMQSVGGPLAAMATRIDQTSTAEIRDAVLAYRPRLTGPAAQIADGTAAIATPHRALVVLLLLVLRIALR